ncbi:MAG: hypothetical protein MMC33_000571 [Icmadophila ericetorum]|nr:hypothetical protein [Icmadophila ericetorum]
MDTSQSSIEEVEPPSMIEGQGVLATAVEESKKEFVAKLEAMENQDVPSTPPVVLASSRPLRGRGSRGGRIRVARGAAKAVATPSDPTALATPNPLRVRGKNRGGRPRGSRKRGTLVRGGRGGKRKRGSEGEDDGHDDTDASETFTPQSQSRSGRKIFQNATKIPFIKVEEPEPEINETPPVRRAPISAPATIPVASLPAKRRKVTTRRPPGAAAVCKNCGRGHSPNSNVIVFCDGCNKPWHQYCHDPPIRGDLMTIAEKEWFCAECTIVREEKILLQGRISGEGLSLAERRTQLLGLPHKTLVSLLLHATTLHSTIPIFSPPGPPPPSAPSSPPLTFTQPPVRLAASAALTTALAAPSASSSSHSQPLTSPPAQPALPINNPSDLLEEGAYIYEEDTTLLPYPKAGNGIQLAPEAEDLNFLLDLDHGIFSHRVWRGPEGGRVGVVRG